MVNQRELAINLMCAVVDNLNRSMVGQNGMTEDQIEQWISSQALHLRNVNAMIYDELNQNGFIANNF